MGETQRCHISCHDSVHVGSAVPGRILHFAALHTPLDVYKRPFEELCIPQLEKVREVAELGHHQKRVVYYEKRFKAAASPRL